RLPGRFEPIPVSRPARPASPNWSSAHEPWFLSFALRPRLDASRRRVPPAQRGGDDPPLVSLLRCPPRMRKPLTVLAQCTSFLLYSRVGAIRASATAETALTLPAEALNATSATREAGFPFVGGEMGALI